MSHNRTVQDEFTRQAQSFARATTLQAPELTARIAEALGERCSGRVLDMACGPGVLTAVLCRSARRVVGLDLTTRVLEVARSACDTGRSAFVRGTAEAAPLASESFDGVALRLALHHVEAPARVLREVHRLLRPGGRLVVLDILTSTDPQVAARHNEIERARDPSHTAFRPGDELRSGIEAAGLRVTIDERWSSRRDFAEWAAIIDEPARMAAVERSLRALLREGDSLGIGLREEDGALCFDYHWGLFAADA